MKRFRIALFLTLIWLAAGPGARDVFAEAPSQAASLAFDSYAGRLESRLQQEHGSSQTFLAGPGRDAQAMRRLQNGAFVIEQLTPASGLDSEDALLHDWRGTAFIPGATVAQFEGLMRNLNSYPQIFSPEVLRAGVTGRPGDRERVWMRVRQRHVLTVVLDASYDVIFGELDPQHGYSVSRSVQVSEIDSPGTARERVLTAGEEHGFLWRMNTYWSFEERDGGLVVQIESISLTRSIPRGLGWAVGPYVGSIPRESLEFTLRAVCNALRR